MITPARYPGGWESGCGPADPQLSNIATPAYAGTGYGVVGSGEVGTINPGLNTPVTQSISIQLNPTDTTLSAALTRVLNSGDDRERLAQYLAAALQQYGAGGGGGGGSAPSDGKQYVQQNGVWVPATGPAPSNIIYGSDDFIYLSWSSGYNPGVVWIQNGANLGWGPNSQDHIGVLDVASPNGSGKSSFMIATPQQPPFSNIAKAVARFVVSKSGSFSTAAFNGEWFVGFIDSVANQQNGALFSYAPGFTGGPSATGGGPVSGAGGLLAGTYNNAAGGHLGYIQTNFTLTDSQWYDLIVVWTPTACRFYAGSYGSDPPLVATITTNISTLAQYVVFMNSNNADPTNVHLYVDRVEWLWQLISPLYKGQNLASL